MKYKIPLATKSTFIVGVVLFVIGLALDNYIQAGIGVIILNIVGAQIEIMKKLHSMSKELNNGKCRIL